MTMPLKTKTLAVGVAAFCAAAVVHASEPDNLSDGAPLAIEDTKVTETGKWQYQLPLIFERKSNGSERLRFEPEVRVGILRNWHGSLTVPLHMGSADRTGSGDLRLGVQGKLSEESGWLPSFGVSLSGDLPTGKDSEGVDTRLKLLATKSLPTSTKQHVHLNALFEDNAKPLATERSSRRGMVLGYDVEVRSNTVVLADYVYEQGMEIGSYDRLLEVGLRHKVKEGVLGLGVGIGLGESATDWRLGFSWQHNL